MKRRFLQYCLLIWTISSCRAVDFFVPGVANATSDSGQHQATEVRVANQEATPARVTFRFLPANDAAAPEPFVADVAAGQILSYRNVLREIWNLEETSGVLAIRADRSVQMWSSRYSDMQEMQTAVDLPALPDTALVSAGQTGELPWLARSADFRGEVWAYLDSAESSAELILLDGSGAELARRTLAGGPKAVRMPLAELTADDVPIARVRIEVTAGRVGAFGEISQTATNDSMGAPALVVSRLASQQVIAPVLHLPAPGGGILRTDLRLYNPRAQSLVVTLVFRDVRKSITLAPKETREVQDVLGSLFEIGEEASGTVLVFAASPVVALARTVAAAEWASGSIAAEIHPLEPFAALAGVSEPGSTAGAPNLPAAAWLVTRSASEISSANLTLRNASGDLILTSPNPVTLDPNTARFDPLADALGGSLPEGPHSLQLTPASGLVSAAILSLRPGSNDPSFQILEPEVPASCPAPEVAQFRSSASSLSAPGEIVLEWNVAGAETINIAPGLDGLPPSGSRPVALTASTVFTLRATNSCGADEGTLSVPVGLPSLTSLGQGSATGAPREGSPGQLLVLKFDNLNDPQQIEFLVARAADGAERPVTILNATQTGVVYARVPFWLDLDAARGYRTGAVQISGRLADGRRTAALPFTITALSYSGDPVAGFRRIVDSLSATMRESFEQVRNAGLATLAAEQERAAAPNETALRLLLSDIATRGSGTLTYGAPAVGNPNAISVVMTRQDLGELLAFNDNVAATFAALDAPDPALAREPRLASSPTAGTCLALKQPLIPICKLRATKQRIDAAAVDAVSDFFTDQQIPQSGQAAIDAWVKKQLAKTALGAALKKIQSWLTPLDVMCLVYPIRLDRFTINPKFIPNARYESQATAVKISAFLKPETPARDIARYLEKREAQAIADYLKLKGMSRTTAQTFIRAFLQAANFDLDVQIARIVSALGNVRATDSIQVGQCDLFTVYPKLNGPGTGTDPNSGFVTGRSRLRFATSRPFGMDDYFLMGVKPGPETLCIIPFYQNFLFSDAIERRQGSLLKSKCPFAIAAKAKAPVIRAAGEPPTPAIAFSDDLDVGEGQPGAELYIENVEAGGDPTYAHRVLPSPVSVSAGYRRSANDGQASATVDFSPIGKNSWSLNIETLGLKEPGGPHYGFASIDIRFRNPENRDGTQRIRMTASVRGDPQCVISAGIHAVTATGGRQDAGTSMGTVSFDLPGAIQGNIGVSAAALLAQENVPVFCAMKGTVELLDK